MLEVGDPTEAQDQIAKLTRVGRICHIKLCRPDKLPLREISTIKV